MNAVKTLKILETRNSKHVGILFPQFITKILIFLKKTYFLLSTLFFVFISILILEKKDQKLNRGKKLNAVS